MLAHSLAPVMIALVLSAAAPAQAGVTAALVPGCPTDADGQVSACQWRRALWAAHLFEQGRVASIMVSGAAVHTPYVEAEALQVALLSLGVPSDRVVLETQARHTDENVAFSLSLAKQIGVDRILVASDGLQVDGMMLMMNSWASEFGVQAERASIRYRLIAPNLRAGPPALLVEPAPEGQWVGQREDRESSPARYLRYLLTSARGGATLIPQPPGREPSLTARR